MTEPRCAQLHVHSYFSVLDAPTPPESLVSTAAELGLSAIALTDHNSVGGLVRFWKAAERVGIKAIFGAEVTLEDHSHLTLLAENQVGWGNLCRLVSASRLDQVPGVDDEAVWLGKVEPALSWERLAQHRDGLIAL